jgi:hypothetical protein
MSVTITINGDGLALSREISLQKAGQIITFIGTDENLVSANSTSEDKIISGPSTMLSPRDAIIDADAKTNAQKITVITSYLTSKEQVESVNIKTVLVELRKMGEEPGNFNRDVRAAESLQYIYWVNIKNGLVGISGKGRQAITEKFANEVKVKSKSKGGVFKKAIPPREEVQSLTISANLESFPDFHDLQTKADSILWILSYADSYGISELTPREVEVISDKLKNKIAQNTFSAHNKKNIKRGFVSSTDGKFKLQQKGIDHLKAAGERKPYAEG